MFYERSVWDRLKEAEKPIVIYGTGDGADKLFSVCEEKGIAISGVFASDDFVRNKVFHGFPVTSFQTAKEKFGDMISLLAFGSFLPEVMEKIRLLSEEVELYAPELPLFDSPLFDGAYFEKSREKIEKIPSLLADEKSKEVFRALIQYRLSGKISYLLNCQSPREEIFHGLIPFHDEDIFLDLGAYDGDTALEFDRERGGKYKGILAFEPNEKAFRKLLANTAPLRALRAFPYAAWNKKETLLFNGKSGRSAAVCDGGKTEVQAMPPDKVCPAAQHIKMDVEGSEMQAIEGCRNLIQKCHPTLWISAYHRTQDLFDLPLKILEIAPYKIYLRHFPYIPAWDTLYFFA